MKSKFFRYTFFEGKQLAFIREQPNLLGTPKDEKFAFRKCGRSGIEISNQFPHLQGVADELCFIKTLHTEQFNHAPAQLFSLTGFNRFGRPSIGSRTNYGLGSEYQNLPGFVVQLFDQGWDHHGSVFDRLPGKCRQVDRPIAALIKDLRNRGLLDDTLVVWNAEFGRTPMAQGTSGNGEARTKVGRDHHKEAYTVWMAGSGTKPGHVHGETDELGYSIAKDPVHVHDFNATLLQLLGIDHQRLTIRYQGRQFRLTDVHGRVVRQVLS